MGLSEVHNRPILKDLCARSTYRETTDLSNLSLSWRNVQKLQQAKSKSLQPKHLFLSSGRKNLNSLLKKIPC